jgi:hypothetical protein
VGDLDARVLRDRPDVVGDGEARGLLGLRDQVGDVEHRSLEAIQRLTRPGSEQRGDRTGEQAPRGQHDDVGAGDRRQRDRRGTRGGRDGCHRHDRPVHGADRRLAQQRHAIGRAQEQRERRVRRRVHQPARVQQSRRVLDAGAEVAAVGGQPGDDQVAHCVTIRGPVGKALRQTPVAGQRHEAVADVARWGDPELTSQAAAGSPVVGNAHDRRRRGVRAVA